MIEKSGLRFNYRNNNDNDNILLITQNLAIRESDGFQLKYHNDIDASIYKSEEF